jgi:hypothetical protein
LEPQLFFILPSIDIDGTNETDAKPLCEQAGKLRLVW